MKQIVLDNEAVQALLVPGHPKKRTVQGHFEAQIVRRKRGRRTTVAVPVAVRVEAGWDRRSPAAADINRRLIVDVPLDTRLANEAASIQAAENVGVADAQLGALVRGTGPTVDVVVLTSDPDDVRRVCGDRAAIIVRV